jgi:hypothetical protein
MARALAALIALGTVFLTAAPGEAATRPKAPRVVGLTLEGKRVNLAQFRGKPVFINVWSSW